MPRVPGRLAALLVSAALPLVPARAQPAAEAEAERPQPVIDVVFCLDTTGSMHHLLSAARDEIRAIIAKVAAGLTSIEELARVSI